MWVILKDELCENLVVVRMLIMLVFLKRMRVICRYASQSDRSFIYIEIMSLINFVYWSHYWMYGKYINGFDFEFMMRAKIIWKDKCFWSLVLRMIYVCQPHSLS